MISQDPGEIRGFFISINCFIFVSMASNGLDKRAKNGTCRICQRVRNTEKYLKAVGEVRHGFATGHIWECRDAEECDKTAKEKLNSPMSIVVHERIKSALAKGRFTKYEIFT
jgi:hypothetical protein